MANLRDIRSIILKGDKQESKEISKLAYYVGRYLIRTTEFDLVPFVTNIPPKSFWVETQLAPPEVVYEESTEFLVDSFEMCLSNLSTKHYKKDEVYYAIKLNLMFKLIKYKIRSDVSMKTHYELINAFENTSAKSLIVKHLSASSIEELSKIKDAEWVISNILGTKFNLIDDFVVYDDTVEVYVPGIDDVALITLSRFNEIGKENIKEVEFNKNIMAVTYGNPAKSLGSSAYNHRVMDLR